MATPTNYTSGLNLNFGSVLNKGKELWNAGTAGLKSIGQQLETANTLRTGLQQAAPQLLHSLVPMGGVLRSGGLPAIAGMAGMVSGRNTLAPLFEGPTPKQFGTAAATAPIPPT